MLGGAPPDAGLHAIFHADHGLHDVVQLVVAGVVAIGPHGLEIEGVVVEAAGQLMGAALVEPVAIGVIPRVQTHVGIEGGNAEPDGVQSRIIERLAENGVVRRGSAVLRLIIHLVYRQNGYNGASAFLIFTSGDIEKLSPARGIDLSVRQKIERINPWGCRKTLVDIQGG